MQRRQPLFIDLQQREVRFLVDADNLGVNGSELAGIIGCLIRKRCFRHHYPNGDGAFDDMRVGHDVAVRIDDHSRSNGFLSSH